MYSVWEISILHFPDKTSITGVVVNGNTRRKWRSNVFRIISYYFVRPVSNLKLRIHVDQEVFSAETDRHGEFQLIIPQAAEAEVKVVDDSSGEPLEIFQKYPIDFDYRDTALHVVSDIDDTILISHSPYAFKRIKTVLFKGPSKRKSIPFTHELLTKLEEEDAGFHYVSKSESNLFPNLTQYFTQNKLPIGNFYLTPLIRARWILSYKKEKDHKVSHIRFLLENTGDSDFILIGDDGQRDIEIYSEICQQYSDRIRKVFIHKNHKTTSAKKEDLWQKLVETGVDALYYRGNLT